MAEGKRISFNDLFERRKKEIQAERDRQKAWEATPEGKEWRAEQDAHDQRMREADERFARENPPDRFAEGKNAALSGESREPPDDLSDEDAELWLNGWDSEDPGDDG